MFGRACRRVTRLVAGVRRAFRVCLWARPLVGTHAAGTGADLLRSRAQLLVENALLRQQLLVLRRAAKRPAVECTRFTGSSAISVQLVRYTREVGSHARKSPLPSSPTGGSYA